MPIYEYACPNGCVAEHLRPYEKRDGRVPPCMAHGKRMKRIPSAHHAEVDGIYSYAPNIGSAARYERQQQAMRDGTQVIKRTADEA